METVEESAGLVILAPQCSGSLDLLMLTALRESMGGVVSRTKLNGNLVDRITQHHRKHPRLFSVSIFGHIDIVPENLYQSMRVREHKVAPT